MPSPGQSDTAKSAVGTPWGTAGGGGYVAPKGPSPGCNKPNGVDEPGKYTSHDIEVTGVDPYWLTQRKPYAGQAPYTFTHRSFAIRLPTGYEPAKPYPLVFQGGGCGNTDGTGIDTGATPDYFWSPENPPLDTWNFNHVWVADGVGYPTLG